MRRWLDLCCGALLWIALFAAFPSSVFAYGHQALGYDGWAEYLIEPATADAFETDAVAGSFRLAVPGLLFQAHLYDYETGLYLMRARVYDPRTGSFLQRDPENYTDSVNPYAGMGWDPINRRDPTGRLPPTDVPRSRPGTRQRASENACGNGVADATVGTLAGLGQAAVAAVANKLFPRVGPPQSDPEVEQHYAAAGGGLAGANAVFWLQMGRFNPVDRVFNHSFQANDALSAGNSREACKQIASAAGAASEAIGLGAGVVGGLRSSRAFRGGSAKSVSPSDVYAKVEPSDTMFNQTGDYGCGAACGYQTLVDDGVMATFDEVSGAMNWKGGAVEAGQIARGMNGVSGGSPYLGGVLNASPEAALAHGVGRGGFVAGVSTPGQHWIMVDKVTDGVVHGRDPWGLNGPGSGVGISFEISLERFMRLWQGSGYSGVWRR